MQDVLTRAECTRHETEQAAPGQELQGPLLTSVNIKTNLTKAKPARKMAHRCPKAVPSYRDDHETSKHFVPDLA